MSELTAESPRFICHKCGFGFNRKAVYCPNCASALQPDRDRTAPSMKPLLFQIGLWFVALYLAGFAADAAMRGGMPLIGIVVAVVIPLLMSGICIWGAFKFGSLKDK